MNDAKIAYFSMEIGLESGMPTYSGGLGVLAGDTVRAAADLRVPMVAVTLLHRKGYFYQRLDANGRQREESVEWVVEDYLEERGPRTSVILEGRSVRVRSWRYEVSGSGGFVVPVYFLDTDLPENSEWDRTLTHFLYGGDQHYRLCQEVVLGMGGVRMLRALGYASLDRFHMNEGHSSLLALELLDEEVRAAERSEDVVPASEEWLELSDQATKKSSAESVTRDTIEAVRKKCIFTTHTPVPAGQDQFPLDLVNRVLGRREVYEMKDVFCCEDRLNMTYLALNLSHYINGVAKRHGEVSRLMFAHYDIDAITNGVHAVTWT
ncbi:MAG: alpha-glucan family phosphorylase, partial [Deltaproteobacteria bacterium]|nr:alpha-glucan family phosphorylase [Deltaproteobacteria bacterium]